MKKYYIYIFRHGETTYNCEGKFTGFHNPPLTKKGHDDAYIISQRLKDKKFEIAIQTPLLRSKQTLKAVLKYHPECKSVLVDSRIKERNYGQLNGHTHAQIVHKYGFIRYDKWHRDFNTRPPKGESFADVEARVNSFIKDLKKLIKKEKTNVAISAHGNSIRLFRKIMTRASKAQAVQWTIPYDNYETYEVKV